MIAAFHVIEHLAFDEQVTFLSRAARKLRPGGCLLLETPNAKSIVTAASDFYRDPTHTRPVHPDTLVHFLREAGFVSADVRFLHPFDDERARDGGDEENEIKDLLFGARDCAVIARTPAT